MFETAHPTTAVTPRKRGRVALVAIAAAIGLTVLGVGPAVAASAAPAAPGALPAATGNDGWVRLAHLSPDTKAVDIQLTALSGGTSLIDLKAVGYGVVSDYMLLPVGTYVVAMRPAGASSSTKAMIDASIKVVKDKSITVAAFGENSDLKTRVFTDDLTTPEAGASRIRLIQASTVTDSVSVVTTTGLLIAKNAKAGQSTSYASVPAGPWDLQLTAKGIANTAPINLSNGSVNTLFVLDNSTGGLTVMPVLDSASVGAAPIGGVQTGGGALAEGYTDAFADIGTR